LAQQDSGPEEDQVDACGSDITDGQDVAGKVMLYVKFHWVMKGVVFIRESIPGLILSETAADENGTP